MGNKPTQVRAGDTVEVHQWRSHSGWLTFQVTASDVPFENEGSMLVMYEYDPDGYVEANMPDGKFHHYAIWMEDEGNYPGHWCDGEY